MQIVTADIGGTHARFALAELGSGGAVSLGEAVTLKTAQHASLVTAFQAFARSAGGALPRAAAIAVACPIAGEVLQLTNNPWVIRPAHLAAELGLDQVMLVNDFGAVAHALGHVPETTLDHVCGPQIPLPESGVISVIGAGTGLGAAQVLRQRGAAHVIETEGGHIDFAPLDRIEDELLRRLRGQYLRVSVERVVSGPGLRNIYETLAAVEGEPIQSWDDRTLWQAAIARSDRLATAALERYCLCLGAVVGDLALAQGAHGVALAGGVCERLAEVLPASGFANRFAGKGRFASRMAALPVKLIRYPQPGLLGAAVAFAKEHL